MLAIVSAVLVAWCWGGDSAGVEGARWAHSASLGPDTRLLWAPGSRDITFELQARTRGYVALGLSRDGKMPGADLVVGWVRDGQVYLQDRHIKYSSSGSMKRDPEIDSSQDYQLLLGYENQTHTVLRFRRLLDTCDPYDVPITNDTMRVIWSVHPLDPLEGSGSGVLPPPHPGALNGMQSIYLMQRVNQEVPAPDEEPAVNTWDLRNEQVQLLAQGQSLHWCHLFKPPLRMTTKQHVIRYEPLLEDSGRRSVHHMTLYECHKSDDILHFFEKPGKQCYELGNPFVSCRTVVARWSRGSEGFSFPPEAGYPLDAGTLYLLETLYAASDEPRLGLVDGSGLRLYVTPQLRRHDAGVLSVGMEPNWRHIIPPGQSHVVSAGHCVSDCTRHTLPSSGINVFAVALQTSQIGRKVVLRQLRKGIEEAPILTDDNVDVEYAEVRRIASSVRVYPGDHLIVECTYNSSEREAITLGGRTDRKETCLATLMYYPRQNSLAVCHSLPSLSTVLQSLGIRELQPGSNPLRISAPPELAGTTLETRLLTYDWQRQFDSFQIINKMGPFKTFCWSSTNTVVPGTENLETYYPDIKLPYKIPERKCFNHQRKQVSYISSTSSDNLVISHTSKEYRSTDSIKQTMALSGQSHLFLSHLTLFVFLAAFF